MEKEFEYKEEYGWLTNICLNVTDACNLACRYCFVEQHPHFMTLDVAKQAVHFILDNLEKKNKKFNTNNRASITYFGGEPILMWDEIIVPLTNYIKENNFPIDLGITTNGTLLNTKKIEFLKNNEIIPLLSIDGDRKTQEYNRPCKDSKNSFDLVYNNIPKILEAFPDTTFRATIYSETVENLFNDYIFAVKNNFKNAFFIPDSRHEWNEKQKEQLKLELHKIFCFMHFCFINEIKPINCSSLEEGFINMLKHDLTIYQNKNESVDFQRSLFRCGLGTTFGSVGFDGSIYGCQEQPSKDNKNIFYIGNINTGIDKTRHSQLLSKYVAKNKAQCVSKELCNNCDLRNICFDNGCPSSNYDLFNNFFITSEINCLWRQILLEESIWLNNKLVKENNICFKNFLDIQCNFNYYLKQKEVL